MSLRIPAAESLDYVSTLRQELSKRQSRNMSYSLRAYARDLGVSPSHLSAVLNEKEKLSLSAARQIANKLGYDPEEQDFFVNLVRLQRLRLPAEKATISRALKSFLTAKMASYSIHRDEFSFISDCHHLAILSAAEIHTFKKSLSRIARSLRLPLKKAQLAAERLSRLGLATWDSQSDVFSPLRSKTMTSSTVPSVAIQNFHRQALAQVAANLAETPIMSRFLTTSFIAIPESAMAEMEVELTEFLRDFVKRFEDRHSADQVYQLSLVLMPLLSREKNGADPVAPTD